jgi:hypothetical protein
MVTKCFPTISPETLQQEWDQVKAGYNNILAQIKKTLEKETLADKELTFGKEMLETLRDKADKVFKKAHSFLHNEEVVCCGWSGKQIKAYIMTGLETLTGVGNVSTALIQTLSSDPSEVMKTALLIFAAATLVFSKMKDYFFAAWGKEEKNQKILLKIEDESSIITNIECTIFLTNHLIPNSANENSTPLSPKKRQEQVTQNTSDEKNDEAIALTIEEQRGPLPTLRSEPMERLRKAVAIIQNGTERDSIGRRHRIIAFEQLESQFQSLIPRGSPQNSLRANLPTQFKFSLGEKDLFLV